MYFEINTVDELKAHIEQYASLSRVVCQDLDLKGASDLLLSLQAAGAVFLGCEFEARVLSHVTASGGVLFPELPDIPYKPYRAKLYNLPELMEGYVRGKPNSFEEDTLDGKIYSHFSKFRNGDEPVPIVEALAQRLHDHSIDDALYELLRDHSGVVAIMGGHKMQRSKLPNKPTYPYLEVARIARELTIKGFFVATGGGPGAMEAGNLGAWFAAYSEADLDDAVAILAKEASFSNSNLDRYLECGYEVLDKFPRGTASLAIPTWFYGHEPSNQFAKYIAKYFANSIREEGLLAIANRGIIFAPGSAGTIQEIFMDAAQNHYGTFKLVSPMIFYGEKYWTEIVKVYPLLKELAKQKQYGQLLAISDSPLYIVDFFKKTKPVPYNPNFKG